MYYKNRKKLIVCLAVSIVLLSAIVMKTNAKDSKLFIKNKGVCWIEKNGYYDIGVAYETNDRDVKFQWLSYNLDTKEWKTVSDWSKGNWSSWKTTRGNYWLLCRMKTSDGLAIDEKCICFRYAFDNFGTYAGGKDGGVLLGCNSPVTNPTYYFKVYNLDTQQWEWGSNQNTQWAMWYPKSGNYWTHFEVYSGDNRLIGQKTYCFAINNLQASSFLNLSNSEIVEKVGPLFTNDQMKTGILASVSMAQFILESGYGKSTLSVEANNCFGMKTNLSGNNWPGSTWDGVSICRKQTSEYIDGSYIVITTDFRKYFSVEDSIADHSAYLLGAKNGSNYRYAGLKGCTDYRQAAQIIKNGGYATSPIYVDSLCRVIETWNLTRFDL